MGEVGRAIEPFVIDETENGNPEFPVNGFVLQALAAQLAEAPNIEGETPSIDVLSSREAQILGLIRQGFKNQIVASQLRISPDTVKNHLTNIYKKLGVDSVNAASSVARIGFRGGLFSEDRFTDLSPALKLNPKERETLSLISEGLANVEIAEIRGVSIFTVYSQVQSILSKLNANNRAHATWIGLGAGLINGLTVNERKLLQVTIPFISFPEEIAETTTESSDQILDEKPKLFWQDEGTEQKPEDEQPAGDDENELLTEEMVKDEADKLTDGGLEPKKIAVGLPLDTSIKLNKTQQTVLRAIEAGISIEEISARSRIPAEKIEEMLQKGQEYIEQCVEESPVKKVTDLEKHLARGMLILKSLKAGKSPEEIAKDAGVSVGTVLGIGQQAKAAYKNFVQR